VGLEGRQVVVAGLGLEGRQVVVAGLGLDGRPEAAGRRMEGPAAGRRPAPQRPVTSRAKVSKALT
jgi:hypothetical protein